MGLSLRQCQLAIALVAADSAKCCRPPPVRAVTAPHHTLAGRRNRLIPSYPDCPSIAPTASREFAVVVQSDGLDYFVGKASNDVRKALDAAEREKLDTVAFLVMPHSFGGLEIEVSKAIDSFREAGWEHYDSESTAQGRLLLFFHRRAQ
jgi:hypothetical protein